MKEIFKFYLIGKYVALMGLWAAGFLLLVSESDDLLALLLTKVGGFALCCLGGWLAGKWEKAGKLPEISEWED